MKNFFFLVLSFIVLGANAQKYALIDEKMIEPVSFTDHIDTYEKYNHFFPVEKKSLHRFVEILESISKEIASMPLKNVKQYQLGCIQFRGNVILHTPTDFRVDYVVNSTCDNINIQMHLCDSELKNPSNLFYVNTLIQYVKSSF